MIDTWSKIRGNLLIAKSDKIISKMAIRINKYLSEVGYCSRRRADRLIEQGKVTINGKVPEIGSKVDDGDQVEVGQRIGNQLNTKKYI